MSKARALYDRAFQGARIQRSTAYKDGVLQMLELLLDERDQLLHPYGIGSAEFDAFSAGCDEGRFIHKTRQGGRECAT